MPMSHTALTNVAQTTPSNWIISFLAMVYGQAFMFTNYKAGNKSGVLSVQFQSLGDI